MKRIIRVVYLLVFPIFGGVAFAAPTVTDVVAKQRYPWGLVDITCKVEGLEDNHKYKLVVEAVFPGQGRQGQRVKDFYIIRNGLKSNNQVVGENGNYSVLWDAKAELGKVRYTNMVVRVNIDRSMVQLWKDGPYWATANIGAEKPEDYGYYFWWGDTVGYKRENNKWVASDGSNSNFSFDLNTTPTYNKSISTLQSEGWIVSKDGAYVLTPEHDAAQAHWGGDWRMPTKQEFVDLNNKCDWTWTTMNGVNGYVVCGRGDYSSASIFLPCAGDGYGTSLNRAGSNGYYWSSVPYSDDSRDVWNLYFYSGNHKTSYFTDYRCYGRSVRPLQGFTK